MVQVGVEIQRRATNTGTRGRYLQVLNRYTELAGCCIAGIIRCNHAQYVRTYIQLRAQCQWRTRQTRERERAGIATYSATVGAQLHTERVVQQGVVTLTHIRRLWRDSTLKGRAVRKRRCNRIRNFYFVRASFNVVGSICGSVQYSRHPFVESDIQNTCRRNGGRRQRCSTADRHRVGKCSRNSTTGRVIRNTRMRNVCCYRTGCTCIQRDVCCRTIAEYRFLRVFDRYTHCTRRYIAACICQCKRNW